MFNERPIYNLMKALESSQRCDEQGVTSYDRTEHVYSVTIDVGYYGTINARVHVQWQLLQRMLIDARKSGRKAYLTFDSDVDDAVHLYLYLDGNDSLVYTAVMFKYDLQRNWRAAYGELEDDQLNADAKHLFAQLRRSGEWN